jgi:hypothetical protein
MPPVSPEFCALRMMVVAYLHTLPRRKGQKFLGELALILASEESIRTLFPSRPKHERRAAAEAQAAAAAWVKEMLPELWRALPPA